MRQYKSKTSFVYEEDLTTGLSPGASADITFNTHGDSDFFWQKFAAYAVVDSDSTTRTGDELPSLVMTVTNTTTGRTYQNVPVAVPNISGYQQFEPMMTVWPQKSSILVTLDNIATAVSEVPLTILSGLNPNALGIGVSGEDAEFFGYVSPVLTSPDPQTGVIGPNPAQVAGQTILALGIFQFAGVFYLYLITDGGSQFMFGEMNTQLKSGPVNGYTAAGAFFLAEGDSGTFDGIPLTATAGPLWVWADVIPADFANGEITTVIFPFAVPSFSAIYLSFMGTKAFP